MRRALGLFVVLASCSRSADPEPPAPSSGPAAPVVGKPGRDASAPVVGPPRAISIAAGDAWTIDLQCGDTFGKDVRVGETIRVHVDAFQVDESVVTCGQWDDCVAAKACSKDEDTCRQGKARVSRVEAIAYCRWRGGRRLPSSSQWMRAVRGDSRQRYPMGDRFDEKRACDRPTSTLADFRRCEFTSPAGVIYAMENPNNAEWTRDELCLNRSGRREVVSIGLSLSGNEFDVPYPERAGRAEFRCVSP